jgi:hypothetical protein
MAAFFLVAVLCRLPNSRLGLARGMRDQLFPVIGCAAGRAAARTVGNLVTAQSFAAPKVEPRKRRKEPIGVFDSDDRLPPELARDKFAPTYRFISGVFPKRVVRAEFTDAPERALL